jgi:hypothetical protein
MIDVIADAFYVEIEKIAEHGGQSGENIVEFGEKTPRRYFRNPKRYVSVPIKDPISGRTFSHAERARKQSLRLRHRGPGWKETHPASEQPGKSEGPIDTPENTEAFWGGAAEGEDLDKALKRIRAKKAKK